VRLGMFMMPLHPVGRTTRAYLAEDTEKAILLDTLGYDELWVGEHFTASTEPYPSPLMFMASLLSQTKKIKFAVGTVNAPNHHPARTAAEAAQFDHMSGGRFVLGVGTGSLPTDSEVFGVKADSAVKARMLVEHIEMVERIWAEDPPYDMQGEFWNVKLKDARYPEIGVGFMPRPFQSPRPPICIPSSTPASKTTTLCGQRGWEPISSALLPGAMLGNHWKNYRQGCIDAGRDVENLHWRLARNVLVAPTDEEARARAFSAEGSQRYHFNHFFKVFSKIRQLDPVRPRPGVADADITVDDIIESRLIYGSPRTVATKLATLRKAIGPFGTLLISGMDWSGPNAEWERESLTLLAREVRPLLREQIAIDEAAKI
jgi:alkanesulfonate monooxygenase SsuD/methylene tetrahydromethanopterin reductase-like flavin-dependent oxidoreductase (luciferase family)